MEPTHHIYSRTIYEPEEWQPLLAPGRRPDRAPGLSIDNGTVTVS